MTEQQEDQSMKMQAHTIQEIVTALTHLLESVNSINKRVVALEEFVYPKEVK